MKPSTVSMKKDRSPTPRRGEVPGRGGRGQGAKARMPGPCSHRRRQCACLGAGVVRLESTLPPTCRSSEFLAFFALHGPRRHRAGGRAGAAAAGREHKQRCLSRHVAAACRSVGASCVAQHLPDKLPMTKGKVWR